MSKRPAFNMKEMQAKKAKLDAIAAAPSSSSGTSTNGGSSGTHPINPFLSQPVQPEKAIQIYLMQFRHAARRYYQQSTTTTTTTGTGTGTSNSTNINSHITKPFCEIEVRLGLLKVQHAIPDRRVTSSGAKHAHYPAYDCSNKSCTMVAGVNRTHYIRTTSVGISEVSAISQALRVNKPESLKRDIIEKEMIETVFTGYSNAGRVCFDGEYPTSATIGKLESKERLMAQDLTIPAANFDVRISLSSEKMLDNSIQIPPTGWQSKRIKRRRSYYRSDKSIAWQIDVTEVTTTENATAGTNQNIANPHTSTPTVAYEIEFELLPAILLQLLNEQDENMLKKMTVSLAQQLWHIIMHMNPLKDALNVEEALQDHTNYNAVQLAIEQCHALRAFMDNGCTNYSSPIGSSSNHNNYISTTNRNTNFIGCMPINFSRHNLDEIQRASEHAYYLSEKTDGVRHFMIFTGNTVVLIDRAMRGKQPKLISNHHNATESHSTTTTEPFASIIDLIRPGTVLDGEVVMNRRTAAANGQPRPVFIVFDVLAISTTEPVLHLPFAQRLQHLRQASFRTPNASRDMFDARYIHDMSIPLPLVRKNFVKCTELDDLFNNVHEERGMRCYRSGELHNHLTDGIIFQPNMPYVCGTDVNLLKWKYLDTVTVDVEIIPPRRTDDENTLRVGCLGEEQTLIDMTRYVLLPQSERLRLEADRFEVGGTIAEVGFDPETGEWYYVTMRSDKVTPNHISTVLGTLLELAESLTTDELRYRMGIPAGTRDTYRKDMRGMFKQLLNFQRQKLQSQRAAAGASNGTR